MAKKTTKAQRRAAKLNRRSKDYRRKIAAQSRKEEQAKKNPTKKKAYKPRVVQPLYSSTNHEAVALHNSSGIRDLYITFTLSKDDKFSATIGTAYPGMSPDTMEAFVWNDDPTFKAAYAVRMPSGSSVEEADAFIMEPGTVDFVDGLLKYMARNGIRFSWNNLGETRVFKRTHEAIEAEGIL